MAHVSICIPGNSTTIEHASLYRILQVLTYSSPIFFVELKISQKSNYFGCSYLDPCLMSKNKRARREYLLENYLFNCNCERCMEEDTEDEEDSEEEDEEPFVNPDSFS